jgi:hypothetical protein
MHGATLRQDCTDQFFGRGFAITACYGDHRRHKALTLCACRCLQRCLDFWHHHLWHRHRQKTRHDRTGSATGSRCFDKLVPVD